MQSSSSVKVEFGSPKSSTNYVCGVCCSQTAHKHTHTRALAYANGNHINHTHRAALGGDFCIARNARTAAGIGVKR